FFLFSPRPPRPTLFPYTTLFRSNNTVNSYRRSFTIPQAWSGRHVFLTFDGVNSFFFLWINGQKVGFGKDSRTPVEFDITQFLARSEEHTSELQSRSDLVCRLLLE